MMYLYFITVLPVKDVVVDPDPTAHGLPCWSGWGARRMDRRILELADRGQKWR